MAITQDVVVVNDLSGVKLDRRERTTSTGTHVRYSVDMSAQPILFDFGGIEKSPRVAEAIKDLLTRKMKAITQLASDDTIVRRIGYAKELAKGAKSALARYARGRGAARPPHQHDTLFNDSGRFADGLEVRFNPTEGHFTINVPAARLNPSTFGGGEAAVVAMFQRLVALVPEWKGGSKVLEHPEVVSAIAEDVTEHIFVVGQRGAEAIRKARSRLYAQVFKDVTRVLQLGG